MSRVGTWRWHFGTFQQCVADEPGNAVWAVLDPAWLDWQCVPSEWVRKKRSPAHD